MVESLVIEVPGELVERLDDVVALMGFRSREEFALMAMRRLLGRHVALMYFRSVDDLENYKTSGHTRGWLRVCVKPGWMSQSLYLTTSTRSKTY